MQRKGFFLRTVSFSYNTKPPGYIHSAATKKLGVGKGSGNIACLSCEWYD